VNRYALQDGSTIGHGRTNERLSKRNLVWFDKLPEWIYEVLEVTPQKEQSSVEFLVTLLPRFKSGIES
jgi:hypothetical protein